VREAVLEGLIAEIAPRVVGATVTDAYEPARDVLVLRLAADDPLALIVVTARALPLLLLAESRAEIPEPPDGRPRGRGRPSISRELRRTTLTSLAAVPGGVAELSFARTDPAGRVISRVLAVSLDRRPGLTLRDANASPEADGRPAPEAASEPGPEPAESSAEPDAASGRTRPAPTVAWRRDPSDRLHVTVSAGPVSSAGESRAFATLNAAARFAFAEFTSPLDLERRRGAVRTALARQIRRKKRAVAKVRAELDESVRAEEFRRNGRLLLARKDTIRRGRTPVEVLDYDGRTTVVIDVDPALDAQRNAEAYFRRARKSERRAERAPKRLGELEEELARLTARSDEVGEASDEDLERLEEESIPARKEPPGRKAPSERAMYRTYTVSGDWQVLVGKSNRDNDVLSHRIAKPDDLWFHAHQAAGSHVVLRRAGRKDEPDRQAILEAAAIAAFHSKAGRSSKVAVSYTEKRHVRKPRGAKPGLAVLKREKVVMVRPELPET